MHKGFVRESAEDRRLGSGGLNSSLTAWRPDNQNTMVAQMRPGSAGAYYLSYPDTHIISDASFIRGSGATLGYSLPATVIDRDRKSTRLNSSHVAISYAVFCLKKKNE